jgi:hypothetical protein
MVVRFTTTCAISAYHHSSCEFESRSWPGVLDTILCDRHDITEILLKEALNTINQTYNIAETDLDYQIMTTQIRTIVLLLSLPLDNNYF